MTVRYYSSQAIETTLSSAMTSSQVTMTVTSTAGWPTQYPFTVIIDPDQSGLEEIVQVDSLAASPANTYNITRNGVSGGSVDGGSAVAHATGAVVKHGVSARDFKNSRDHENASAAVHGLSGTVVGTTDTQTLTNKTISGSSNTITNIDSSALATDAVTTVKIADSNVTTAKIANDAITTAKIADSQITSGKILNGTIMNDDINASASIDATKIANGSVSNTEFQYLDGVTSALQTQLDAKAPIASPTFTGVPAAPTVGADTNTTQIATTAFVVGQAASSTSPMDGTAATGTSLKYARQDHVHPTDTSRAPLASPTFTGTVTAPTINATTKFQVNGTDVTGLTGAWTSYTPTISNWTLGTGTYSSYYTQIGKTVIWQFRFTLGNGGTTGSPVFTLPVTAARSGAHFSNAQAIFSVNNSSYAGSVWLASSTTVNMSVNNAGGTYLTYSAISASVPQTWGSGDTISFVLVYEAA